MLTLSRSLCSVCLFAVVLALRATTARRASEDARWGEGPFPRVPQQRGLSIFALRAGPWTRNSWPCLSVRTSIYHVFLSCVRSACVLNRCPYHVFAPRVCSRQDEDADRPDLGESSDEEGGEGGVGDKGNVGN